MASSSPKREGEGEGGREELFQEEKGLSESFGGTDLLSSGSLEDSIEFNSDSKAGMELDGPKGEDRKGIMELMDSNQVGVRVFLFRDSF